MQIINIGNSKDIKIPEAILEQYSITDSVELILEKERIILKPKFAPGKGWEKAFQDMHANGDDQLLIHDVFEDESFEE